MDRQGGGQAGDGGGGGQAMSPTALKYLLNKDKDRQCRRVWVSRCNKVTVHCKYNYKMSIFVSRPDR